MRTIFLLLSLLLSAELGLYLRPHFQKTELNQNGQRRILIYGDSIVQGSLPYISEILSAYNLSLVDKTEAALRTEKIDQQISEDIKRYSPSLIVLMVGKSDLESEKGQQVSPLLGRLTHHSRVLSLLLFHFSQWKERFGHLKSSFRLPFNVATLKNKTCLVEHIELNIKECLRFLNELSNSGQTEQAIHLIEKIEKIPLKKGSLESLKARKGAFLAKVGKDDEAHLILKTMDPVLLTSNAAIATDHIRTLLWLKLSKGVIAYANSLPSEFSELPAILIYKSWASHALFGCNSSIPLFERSMELGFITRNQLSELIKCYFSTNKIEEGFSRVYYLSQFVKGRDELSLSLARFYVALGKKDIADEVLNKFGASHPDDRDLYKGKLALYALSGNDDMLN
ncbi:MAG: hypothetical protein KDD35_12580, partial [Bdellovibrionales bacterium]|nr:hypothetical protein [Bdellovibrionales bacterium]